MKTSVIRLPGGLWRYDPSAQLGEEGGFGAVFEGESAHGEPVAVKRLKITASPAAHRELRIASELLQRDFANVLRVLDAGYDVDSQHYYVVMPRAEMSLQERIDSHPQFPFPDDIALDILRQIAGGLLEVPSLVHRDLKPANILLHAERWKIADFGIARFVEESTSANTLRECLSPPYAAPEQWMMQRVSHATDLYAMGCIAYALLTSLPPFQGGSLEDCKEQHLHSDPPNLNVGSPRLRTLISGLLRKLPESRPSMARVVKTLDALLSASASSATPRLQKLERLGMVLEQEAAAKETEKLAIMEEQTRRRDAAKAARDLLTDIVHLLFARIQDAVPSASFRQNGSQEILDVENAELRFTIPGCHTDVFFAQSKWDVLCRAHVELWQRTPKYCWSSSLWYTNLGHLDGYRWYEVSYCDNPLSSRKQEYAPFYLRYPEADSAAAPVIGVYQIAFGPKPIDDEDQESFMDRWAELLAKAVDGKLCYPRYLPLP